MRAIVVACVTLAAALAIGLLRRQAQSPLVAALPEIPAAASSSPALRRAIDDATQQIRARRDHLAGIRKLARVYHANGFIREARECYQLLPTGAQTARDRYYIADLARQESNLIDATAHFGAVLELDPGYLPARFALAEVYLKLGRDQEAERHFLAVLAVEPNHVQASVAVARIQLQRGEEDAALARLEELMAGHPESASGAGLLARVLERRGEADRAVALKQMSEQKPEPSPADPWMADLLEATYDLQRLGLRFEELFRAGQVAEATVVLRRIEQLEPESSLPQMLRGWSELHAQRPADAIPHFRTALAKGGDPEKIAPYLGQSLLATGQIDAADKLIEGIYARLPDSIPVLTVYADVAVRKQNRPLARALLTKLIEKEPYLQAQNMQLARILWEAGERDAAAAHLQRVAQVVARDIPSRALLGEYFLAKADPRSAIVPLEQAIEHAIPKTPAHQQLRALLGQAYFQGGEQFAAKGELSEALRCAEKLTQLEPRDPRGHMLKATSAVQLGEFRVAASALGAMAGLQPANPTIHLSLGDVVYQSGDPVAARRHWEKARQLAAPTDRALISALDSRLAGQITAETFR